MPICPNQHDSVATDYCDECGTPIGAAPSAPPAPTLSVDAAAGGEPCPDCGTPRSGRFCEVCGCDFLAESPSARPSEAGGISEAATVTLDAGSTMDLGSASWSPGPAAASPPAARRVAVSADRAYHARMLDAAAPDATPVAFPAYCPERRFALTATQVLIGRTSRSRGIQPDIDLTGPPEDAAVSHAHALLVATPDGGWSVVDLDSANGTYHNEGTDPITANVPVPVKDGDRIHVGAWTTLTLHAG